MTAETEVVSFGCRLNAYESALIRDHTRTEGFADAVIVNTCAVTAEAERQARQAIRKLHRDRPGVRVIVTGCAAQIDPHRFAAMPEVDRVIGNAEKLRAETWRPAGTEAPERVLVNDIASVRDTAHHLLGGFEGRTRAFVQVQQGCDHRCTFCIIPYGRGPSRSVPAEAVIAQARALVAAGFQELVLTGVDITSYGADLPDRPPLGALVRALLAAVPDLPRLRLSSIDPVEIDEALWWAIAEEPRLMPHLHLSIQAGSDLVLKRMKRRHGRADVLAVCARARALRPDMVFGADLIAGFPTETEEQFGETLALVAEGDLTWLHVFPYSPRPGTPAAKMPQVPVPVRRERATRLRAAGAAAADRFRLRRVGKVEDVLMEDGNLGRTAQFAELRPEPPQAAGAAVRVRVRAVEGGCLVGPLEGGAP